MDINVSMENIRVACDALGSIEDYLEYQLQYGIPNGKVSFDRKEIIQNQLAKVREALRVFEYYKD